MCRAPLSCALMVMLNLGQNHHMLTELTNKWPNHSISRFLAFKFNVEINLDKHFGFGNLIERN